ncbi:MAG: PAS domain S-box protein [Desulfobacteraceae bacterium]|nr:PAS domain S-box protein [Desulfobacteraceae bacterium]
MLHNRSNDKRIHELEELLEVSERKADILTNLLKEASAEYDQTLKKIKISEENFRAVFENAPEAIYIVETNTRKFLECNPFMSTWLGYTRNELLSMRVEQILESGDGESIQKNIEKTISDGHIHIQARRFKKKDGAIVEAEVTGTLLNYQGKQCSAALVRDITQRKKIEELGRYKELFENVSDLVFINDAQGKLLEVNDVACKFLGYTRKQLLKMSLKDLTAAGHLSQLAKMKNKRISEGETIQFELNLQTRNGLTNPFEFQGRLIIHKKEAAFLSVARNISFRKGLQKTLIRTERFSAVGEMANGVAHNFNNLLQMIMAGAEVARAKLLSGKIRDCEEAIKIIVNASQRGTDVVKRIKDFIHAGKTGIGAGTVFDLNALVTESVELTRPLWKHPSIPRKYRLKVKKGDNCFVKGISSEIYEVLVNLIKNGLEAMHQGGTLTISTYTLNEAVHLVISDTGCGIPEEHVQRIFEPFFTTKGSQSSGLGLSSCYGIVKKFQGDIHVKNLSGQGAEFSVIFPIAKPEEVKMENKKILQTNIPIRFLMIDDEINILRSMEMYFEDSEIDITTVSSAKKGIRSVRENNFDVILCDFGMNDMNGLEVGREIQKFYMENQLKKIPFLLYTGLDKQLDTGKLEESGIDRVINKPTSCEDILNIIREIVSGQRN